MNPQPQIPSEVAGAMRLLADLAGARRYEYTDIEARMWLEFLMRLTTGADVGLSKLMRFLSVWSMRERFVPQPQDAAKALGLFSTPESSFEAVLREVGSCGPYGSPKLDAVTSQTIALMGGWARVCQDAPDASNEFAFNQFRKRFVELFPQAQAQVEVQGVAPKPLLGLADASRQRHLQLSAESSERPVLSAPRA